MGDCTVGATAQVFTWQQVVVFMVVVVMVVVVVVAVAPAAAVVELRRETVGINLLVILLIVMMLAAEAVSLVMHLEPRSLKRRSLPPNHKTSNRGALNPSSLNLQLDVSIG